MSAYMPTVYFTHSQINMSIKKTFIQDRIWILENIISEKFCDNLISEANHIGFRNAKYKNHGRKNKEIIIRQSQKNNEIIKKIEECFSIYESFYFKVNYVSEILEVYKYEIGDFISAHLDKPRYINQVNLETTHTVIIYLNEGYIGGETLFTEKNIKVKGSKGSCLIFDNILLHEALLVVEGTKYIARFDLASGI